MSDTIQADKVVFINYTLKNGAGEVLDDSEGDPLFYLHGHQNIVPGLESQLDGLAIGDTKTVEVAPADGYGEVQPPGEQEFPKDTFPDGIEVEEGMVFHAELPGGNMVPFFVTRVEGDTVWMDNNHPLAGETLFFDVEVVRIRDAHEEEIAHGHPHGPEGASGHHH